jgi:hypothetical protein
VAEMVESVLHLRPALDLLVGMARHNMQAKSVLKKLRLTPQEWELLHQLDPILKV